MKEKKIFELEYILKTSPKVLNNVLFTPTGLADWFCDDIQVEDDIYSFEWDGYAEEARLLGVKNGSYIKWQWIEDEEDGLKTYFGFKYHIDPVTNAVILTVSGSSTEDDMEETKALWEQHVNDLRRLIGA